MRKPGRTRQGVIMLKSPISLKLGTKVRYQELTYCPFRGCAGDWVKLGVAKRHGAVLGDAVSKMADEYTKVQLVESDIPGAELLKPAESCTVAIEY